MILTVLCPCRFLALPRPSLKLFEFCIELEANLASMGNHDDIVTARKLFDSAINQYPQERELWRKYYNMELKVLFTYCYI
jgi:U3 small nucleolar RNA-associated protein 6